MKIIFSLKILIFSSLNEIVLSFMRIPNLDTLIIMAHNALQFVRTYSQRHIVVSTQNVTIPFIRRREENLNKFYIPLKTRKEAVRATPLHQTMKTLDFSIPVESFTTKRGFVSMERVQVNWLLYHYFNGTM